MLYVKKFTIRELFYLTWYGIVWMLFFSIANLCVIINNIMKYPTDLCFNKMTEMEAAGGKINKRHVKGR